MNISPSSSSLVNYVVKCITKKQPSNYTIAKGGLSNKAAVLAVTRDCLKTENNRWLGTSTLQRTALVQWLDVAFGDPDLQILNHVLSKQSFLSQGLQPNLADIVMYAQIIPMVTSKVDVHLRRWFSLLQHLYPMPNAKQISFDKVEEVVKEQVVEEEKKEKKKKKQKKESKKKATKKSEVPEGPPPFGKIDIRVGLIKKAWEHEESEKLWCEEIDVGEDAPRQIASGLRSFFSKEEMEDTRCLVVCNLKARKMAGFKSHGMVLCTKVMKGDVEVVEFVTPPESAPAGTRLTLAGDDTVYAPLVPNQIAKKKVWEKEIGPFLRVNADGSATFKDTLIHAAGEVCRAKSIVDAPIS